MGGLGVGTADAQAPGGRNHGVIRRPRDRRCAASGPRSIACMEWPRAEAAAAMCVAVAGRWALAIDFSSVRGELACRLTTWPTRARPARWNCIGDRGARQRRRHAALARLGAALTAAIAARAGATARLRAHRRRRSPGTAGCAVPRSPFAGLMADLGGWCIWLGGQSDRFRRPDRAVGLDLLHLLAHPGELPRREISANLYKSGVRAMPVTALVGFLIGVVLSYLSSLATASSSAPTSSSSIILGLGIIRELGPVLVAVLVAGRSGSAMTAQLGVMRVTEEIDALATMGVSRSLRLVLPKVVGAGAGDAAAGAVDHGDRADRRHGRGADRSSTSATASSSMTLPKAVPVANLWIGLGKGVVFGIFVALVACHFGLRVRPNTESLSAQHDGLGGDGDHRGDPGRRRVRHPHARTSACRMMTTPVISIRDLSTRFGEVVDSPRPRSRDRARRTGVAGRRFRQRQDDAAAPDRRPADTDARRNPALRRAACSAAASARERALRRRFGVLFQQGALFSAFSVFDNIAFPLRELKQLRRGDRSATWSCSSSTWSNCCRAMAG